MILWSANLIVFSFVILCAAQVKEFERNKSIQDIIDKVYNITSDALAKADPNERVNILRSIETKLKKSSLNFGGKSDKYVHIIMHGVKALIADETLHKDFRKYGDFQPLFDVLQKVKDTDFRKSNNHIVDKIASKMTDIANKHLKDARTEVEKDSIIKKIQNKVMDIALKQTDSNEGRKKVYTKLLKRGVEKMLEKIEQTKRRIENIDDASYKRKFEEGKPLHVIVEEHNDRYLNNFTTKPMVYASTTLKPCDATVSEACADIKALLHYECSGKVVPLKNLCDGIIDCYDKSDEDHCLDQVMANIDKGTRILKHLETYILGKCYMSSDNTIVIKQKQILEHVLHMQRSFLEKSYNKNKTVENIDPSTNEVVVILETVAIALDGSLCRSEIPDRNKMNAQRDLKGFYEDIIDRNVPLDKCSCKNEFCAFPSCPESCKLVCWYKYNLSRWSCHAIDETTSISLNQICDGKLDCYDESDEVACTTGSTIDKFEANEIYEKILNMIELKAKSKEYSSVYNKLMLFYNNVKLLQKTILTRDIDQTTVQDVRDQCFSSLLSIFEDFVKKSASVGDLDDVQIFLRLANLQLVSALKRSYVVLNKIVPKDGCHCRNSRCIVQNCSKICQRACKVRPQLTRYLCKGSTSNMSIPIEWICNDIQDCSFKDDEAQCKIEVCRAYHLRVVKESIRYIGDDKKGTSLGEILRDWRKKAISTLTSAEKEFLRPTRMIYRDIIADILNALVMTYASVEENNYRKNNNNDTYHTSFWNVSQKVMGYLRLCR